ncbi:MAG: effector-associated domain EAD1-containing protein [Myxococcota bacterium]
MNDPWHEDALDGLVAYLEAARDAGGTAWAMVVASSERLGGEVVGELRGRLGRVQVLRLCTYVDPRDSLQRMLDAPPPEDSFRTTILSGVSLVLDEESGDGLLSWLNLHREGFERSGEAFVFILSSSAADRWSREAADFDRYVQRFEFMDWDDLVEEARRAAAQIELEGESGEQGLRAVEQRLAWARSLGGQQVAQALIQLAGQALPQGLDARAEQALSEASRSVGEHHGLLRSHAATLRAYILCNQGRPGDSLRELESLGDSDEFDEKLLLTARSRTYFHLGKPRRALESTERCAELGASDDLVFANLAIGEAWLGMLGAARRHAGTNPLPSKLVQLEGFDEQDEEIVREIAEVLVDEESASAILKTVGAPRSRVPPFRSALDFWAEVMMDARKGVLPGGFARIVDEVAKAHPGNLLFRRYLESDSTIVDAHEEAKPPSMDSHVDASLSLIVGELPRALELLMVSLRFLEHRGSRLLATVIVQLARASLEVARPRRCLELVRAARAHRGSQSATVREMATVEAEALSILNGPLSVGVVIREEEERQRGWEAPIPAAELTYVRGLGASLDEDARRHLQDAADRYRMMEGLLYLSEVERRLARIDRLSGALEEATARVEEGLAWHVREGARPREARDRTELAMIALGRGQAQRAREHAVQALDLLRDCGTRLYEPAALVALAAAERALGHDDAAAAHDQRWRRLVRGIDAKGLEAELERDAAWAASLRPTPTT